MEAPPPAIATDSAWYAEYMKHTDNLEIQQLEQQLAASAEGNRPTGQAAASSASAGTSVFAADGATASQLTGAAAGEKDARLFAVQDRSPAVVLHSKQCLMAERPSVVSADEIIRSTGVLDRPATARSTPGGRAGNLRERANSVPPRRGNGEPTPTRTEAGASKAVGGGAALARPAVYQDIMRSLGLHSEGGDGVGAAAATAEGDPTGPNTRNCTAPPARARPGTSRPRPTGATPPTKLPKKAASHPRDDVTQRYLAFIDELIQEKQDLASRCESLVTQIASLEDRHKQQMSTVREKHKEEIQSSRRALSESERTKRQRWMEKERERIKETTARGVQPQIEQMMRQHAEEQARLKQHYETVLAGGNSGMLDEVRGRLVREKEEAVVVERREAAVRQERQVAELNAQHEAAVARLTAETRDLRCQLQTAGAAAAAQSEDAHRESERRVREARAEAEDSARDLRRRLQDEAEEKVRELREKQRKEIDAALLRQKEELDAAANSRLQAEMQRLKDERDARLEEVIDRLEKEVRRAEEGEAARSAEKHRKLEEKHALDLRALEQSEERFKARFLDARAQLAERDEQLLELRSRCTRKDSELTEMKQTAELLQQEQQQLGDVIEAEFQSQVAELRRAADRWQQRLAEAEHRHQGEMARKQRELEQCAAQREADLQLLHTQIKEAFSTKDSRIEELTASQQLSQKKVKQLENLLDKMRLVGCRCGGGGSARK